MSTSEHFDQVYKKSVTDDSNKIKWYIIDNKFWFFFLRRAEFVKYKQTGSGTINNRKILM